MREKTNLAQTRSPKPVFRDPSAACRRGPALAPPLTPSRRLRVGRRPASAQRFVVMRAGPANLPAAVKVQPLDCAKPQHRPVVNADRTHTKQYLYELESQFGHLRERLSPIGPDQILPHRRPLVDAHHSRDERCRHFELIRIMRQDTRQIVRVPVFYPCLRKLRGEFLTDHFYTGQKSYHAEGSSSC